MNDMLGFTFWHPRRRGPADRCTSQDVNLEHWVPNPDIRSIERFLNWVGLLAKFEYKVTPDVVAVYAIATAQESLIPSRFPCCCTLEDWRSPQRIQDNAPKIDQEGWWPGYRSGSDIIPEMYTMATSYMYERVSDFVRTITMSLNNSPLFRVPLCTTFPKHLCNALRSFGGAPREVPAITTIVNNIKALYATVMPQVSAVDDSLDRCCCSMYRRGKWRNNIPPTIRLNKEEECAMNSDGRLHTNDFVEQADPAVLAGIELLNNHITKLSCILCGGPEECSKLNILSVKEAYCLACEIAVWIIHHVCNTVRHNSYPRPKMAYDEVNCLIAKKFINRNGSTSQASMSCEHTRYVAAALSYLSPTAALCLGEGLRRLIEETRYDMCRGIYSREIRSYQSPCPEVAAYFNTEVLCAATAMSSGEQYKKYQLDEEKKAAKEAGV